MSHITHHYGRTIDPSTRNTKLTIKIFLSRTLRKTEERKRSLSLVGVFAAYLSSHLAKKDVCSGVAGGLLVKPIAQFKKTKSNRNVFAAAPSMGKGKLREFSMPMMLKKPPLKDMRTKSANTRKGL